MEVRLLEDTGEVIAASELFDQAARPADSERFVEAPGHFMYVAYESGTPVGFVSGVEMIHPDKGAEMFLYELGVAEPFRRRGIATSLVGQLRDLARARGCYGMWLLTDADNTPAVAAYRRAGAGEPDPQVLLEWDLSSGAE